MKWVSEWVMECVSRGSDGMSEWYVELVRKWVRIWVNNWLREWKCYTCLQDFCFPKLHERYASQLVATLKLSSVCIQAHRDKYTQKSHGHTWTEQTLHPQWWDEEKEEQHKLQHQQKP